MIATEESIARIRRYAAFKKWSKAKLARKAGLHTNTLRDFDHANWNPRLVTLQSLERLIPADFEAPDDVERQAS